jgi:adenylate cyclase class IV
MSKQKNRKVNVTLEDIRQQNRWYYRGLHQRILSRKDMMRLRNGDQLRLMTVNAPKHTSETL